MLCNYKDALIVFTVLSYLFTLNIIMNFDEVSLDRLPSFLCKQCNRTYYEKLYHIPSSAVVQHNSDAFEHKVKVVNGSREHAH